MRSWGTVSPFAGAAVTPRLALLTLIVLILGVPINDFWRFLLLTLAIMVVCFGSVRLEPLRWLVVLAIAFSIVLVDWLLLPGPRIEEGHNVYIPVGASLGTYEKGLPPGAHRIMRTIFDQAYLSGDAQLPGSPDWWNDQHFQRTGNFVDQAFAPSADALWERPKYSRTVDAVRFRSQNQAQIDVINDKRFNFYPLGEAKKRKPHNFWASARIDRSVIPFFVMVEINPAVVGGTICWRGDTLWEQEPEQFLLSRNAERSCSEVKPQDLGKRVFALAIAPDSPRDFVLEPNLQQRLALWFKLLLRSVGVLLTLSLLVRVDAPTQLLLPANAVVATIVATLLYWPDFVFGFRTHDGGNDGLTHEWFGFQVSQAAARGDFWNALRGGEAVFYNMPGLRYFRAVEDFLFGSAGFGIVLCTMFIPIFLFLLLRRLLPLRWSVVLIVIFLFIPIFERFGFAQFLYVREMWKGFLEPIGYAAFLGALALIAHYIPTKMGAAPDAPMPTFWVGLAMVLSVAMRPNLAIAAALILAMLGVWFLMERRLVSLAGLAVGFAPILLIPWHNWYFGGEIVPFTSSAFIPTNLRAPPMTYVAALEEILRVEFAGPNLTQVLSHLGNWNSWTDFYRLLPLLVALLVVVQRSYAIYLRALALIAVSLQAGLFFHDNKGRYAYLAWLLVFVVLLVVLRENFVPWLRRTYPGLWDGLALRGAQIQALSGRLLESRKNGSSSPPQPDPGGRD
jgi:hypothetical protein